MLTKRMSFLLAYCLCGSIIMKNPPTCRAFVATRQFSTTGFLGALSSSTDQKTTIRILNHNQLSAFVVPTVQPPLHLVRRQPEQHWQRRRQPFTALLAQSARGSASDEDNHNNGDAENVVVEPTWSYVPYDPNNNNKKKTNNSSFAPRRRNFSTWNVPKTVNIPDDVVELNFVRASGSGGQNVNKVSTKVEVRLDVSKSGSFLPDEVKRRLEEQQANRINKEGFLTIASQEYRTQGQNRKAAMAKLEQMILEAWPRPKVRRQRTGVSKVTKERNLDFKKKRSEVKKNRGRVDW